MIASAALGALLVTSIPVLGGDGSGYYETGVQYTVVKMIYVGKSEWQSRGFYTDIDVKHPSGLDRPIEFDPYDGEYELTIKGQRKARAKSRCVVTAWVSQEDWWEHRFITRIRTRLTTRSTHPRRASSTESAMEFELWGEHAWLDVETNGNCAAVRVTLANSQWWWTDVDPEEWVP
jgi:hypothetical protein